MLPVPPIPGPRGKPAGFPLGQLENIKKLPQGTVRGLYHGVGVLVLFSDWPVPCDGMAPFGMTARGVLDFSLRGLRGFPAGGDNLVCSPVVCKRIGVVAQIFEYLYFVCPHDCGDATGRIRRRDR